MCVEIISYFSFFHSPPFFKEGWSQTGVVFEVVLFSVMLNLFQHLIFNIVPYSTFILPSVIANPLPAGEAISILPTLLLLFILFLTSLILVRYSLFRPSCWFVTLSLSKGLLLFPFPLFNIQHSLFDIRYFFPFLPLPNSLPVLSM